MNLTDFNVTGMLTAFNHVKREAEKRGVQVVGSELVGLVPLDALTELVSQVLQLERFSASQIVEMQLATDEG
jgi:glutamate formiminotransferase